MTLDNENIEMFIHFLPITAEQDSSAKKNTILVHLTLLRELKTIQRNNSRQNPAVDLRT